MKIVGTILIGFVVLIASLLFLSCSICAVSWDVPGDARAISVIFALVSLGAMVGGIYAIARLYRRADNE
jgi:hypothetical protein